MSNETYGQKGGDFDGNVNLPPTNLDQQHQQHHSHQQQHHTPMSSQDFCGIRVADVRQRHFGVTHNTNDANISAARDEFRQETGIENPSVIFMSEQTAREMQDFLEARSLSRFREWLNRDRPVNIISIPVLDQGDPTWQTAREMQDFLGAQALARMRERQRRDRPVDVASIPVMGMGTGDRTGFMLPQQRQAGRGALPGARGAQPHITGAGLLGSVRIERPRANQGQEQHQSQQVGQGRRRARGVVHEQEEVEYRNGRPASQGSRWGG